MTTQERARAAWAAAQQAEQDAEREREEMMQAAASERIERFKSRIPNEVQRLLDDIGVDWDASGGRVFASYFAFAGYGFALGCADNPSYPWEWRCFTPGDSYFRVGCSESESLANDILLCYGWLLEAQERSLLCDYDHADPMHDREDQVVTVADQSEQPQSEHLHTIEAWGPGIEEAATKANRRAEPFLGQGFFLRGIRIISEEDGYTYVIALEKGRPTPWEMVP